MERWVLAGEGGGRASGRVGVLSGESDSVTCTTGKLWVLVTSEGRPSVPASAELRKAPSSWATAFLVVMVRSSWSAVWG